MKLQLPNRAENSRDGPRGKGRLWVMLFTTLCVSGLTVGPLFAQGHGGHGGHGGGHSGGGHGGHAGGGHGGGHAGGHVSGGHSGGHVGGAGHIGAGHSGSDHSGVNYGGFTHPGVSHGMPGHVGASRVVTVPSHAGHGGTVLRSGGFSSGNHFSAARSAAHAPLIAHSMLHGATHDFSHWTTPGLHHAAHHFGALHHDHHDFHHGHFGFVGLGFGFYGWSYPYYYDYPYYYPPSYYEVPVYPSTNSPPVYDPNAAPASYVTPLPGETSTATETRVPDRFIPRMEVPSREAPEALPEEKPAEPRRKVGPLESPQLNGSKK